MRESVQDLPAGARRASRRPGAYAVDDPRIVPPPKDRVYTEMEALIQHFLIYSQGFTVPAGEAYVPVEGPRGEHGFYVVSDGTNRPWRVKSRAPSLLACQALRADDRRRPDRRRHRRHRIDRRRDGRRGPVSFHPADGVRRRRFHKSARDAGRRRAEPFAYTPENRARFDEIVDALSARAPPVGGAAARSISCRTSRATSPANAMRHVAEAARLHAGGRRGRRVVLHDVLHAAGRASTCCRCAGRCRAR